MEFLENTNIDQQKSLNIVSAKQKARLFMAWVSSVFLLAITAWAGADGITRARYSPGEIFSPDIFGGSSGPGMPFLVFTFLLLFLIPLFTLIILRKNYKKWFVFFIVPILMLIIVILSFWIGNSIQPTKIKRSLDSSRQTTY